MNTHGHEDVARTAGLPLLEDAFGKGRRSLGALYLGNWLTDVSQAIDPVAYWAGSAKAKGAIDAMVDGTKKIVDGIIEEILATLFVVAGGTAGPMAGRALKALKPDLEPIARRAREALHAEIDFFVAMQTDERDSRLAAFFRSAFLVTGYFKFVHPNAPGEDPRMDFECFMRVFGRRNDTRGARGTSPADDRPGAYTQYYPHEHLDRPEILPPQTPPVYAPGPQTPARPFRVALGKQPGTRSPRRRERIEPDLYSYLRDHIEMTAGLLAEVDLEFQQVFAEGFRDDDCRWYITLAKLGHALHQVEDFFAHSNWIELVAKRRGQQYLAKVIPPTTHIEFIDRAYTTYQKRLKRHLTVPLKEWHKHPDEDWVVTGFFDFQDTLISLAHLLEELWGGDVPDPYAAGHDLFQAAKEAVEHPKTVQHEAQKLMRDTLDFLTNPRQALEDRENAIARSLKDKFEPDVNALRRPGLSRAVAEQVAREVPFLQASPPEIQEAFFDVIVEGTRAYKVGRLTLTVYDTVNEIAEFIRSPLGWLAEWLPAKIKEQVVNALKFYAKERVYDWLGAGRIGCHSLLAKDHGLEPFYKQQKECATAVHYYIVKTLLRWRENQEYVDWLELLEYFLRNPLPPRSGSYRKIVVPVPVTLVHTVTFGEQLKADDPRRSLADKYRPTAMNPQTFTWRDIADANFGTRGLPLREAQDLINRILRDNAWGVPVASPNYAFKEGLRVLIPRQKSLAIFFLPATDDPTWYEAVLDKGWTVFKGYEDPESQTSVPPLEHHRPVAISRDELVRLIQRGRQLRREARQAYRPPAAASGQ